MKRKMGCEIAIVRRRTEKGYDFKMQDSSRLGICCKSVSATGAIETASNSNRKILGIQ